MPTKAEAEWMENIKAIVGCIACRIDGYGYVPADAHHILSGQYRKGHIFTYPLCPEHHRGGKLGPCRHKQKLAFYKRYGSEDYLLDLTKKLLATLKGL
jgi:hypothetical protein